MALELNIHNMASINFKEISMNNLLLFWGAPGGWELIVILVIVLILFGANRLPQLAKGMGESIRNFKQGMAEAEVEDEKSSGKDKAKSA
jgi:sec-independent protein translocase protein TatA